MPEEKQTPGKQETPPERTPLSDAPPLEYRKRREEGEGEEPIQAKSDTEAGAIGAAEEAAAKEAEKQTEQVVEEKEKSEAVAKGEEAETKEAKEDEAGKEEQKEEPKEGIPRGVKRRIDKVTADRYEADERTRVAEARNAELETRLRAYEKPPEQATNGKPELDNFETHEDFEEALFDWKYDRRREAEHREDTEFRAETAYRAKVEKFHAGMDKAREAHEDFAETMDQDILITPAMQDAMADTDVAGEIAYYFGKNPKEAERIAGLGPIGQILAIGKIEASLSNPNPSKPSDGSNPAPQPTGKKPKLIQPLKASGQTNKKPLGEVNDPGEYRRRRAAGEGTS